MSSTSGHLTVSQVRVNCISCRFHSSWSKEPDMLLISTKYVNVNLVVVFFEPLHSWRDICMWSIILWLIVIEIDSQIWVSMEFKIHEWKKRHNGYEKTLTLPRIRQFYCIQQITRKTHKNEKIFSAKLNFHILKYFFLSHIEAS